MIRTQVTGTTKVFRKDYEGRALYSTSIGKKKQDGTWENAYINLQFKKGVDIADGTMIDIQNGWLTFYMNKEGKAVWQLFISEFEGEIPDGFEQVEDYAALDDSDDIPF
jgi:hypothetical protein